MIWNTDHFNDLQEPKFILTKPGGERINAIKCLSKSGVYKFNQPNEISFSTALKIDNIQNALYENIKVGMGVEVEDQGKFVITSCPETGEGTDEAQKQCTAISKEVLLGQKYLEEFYINLGTTGSIDGVCFLNLQDPSQSLLHLVLEKCPDWTIGHVDIELMTMQRSFEITRQDVYSFITTDMAEAFDCVFIFDSLRMIINVYTADKVGKDTDVYISYNNLAKQHTFTENLDEIKTCLTVKGADDLNLREVNMGYDRIYMLDYFHDLKYMSQGLYDAYGKWKVAWDENVKTYTDLLGKYQECYKTINELETRLPEKPDSTEWSEYGLNELETQLKAYEETQSLMITNGDANPNATVYYDAANNAVPTEEQKKKSYEEYMKVFNAVEGIKQAIETRKNEINEVKDQQKELGSQMNDLIAKSQLNAFLNTDELKELSNFIREDELITSNYVVTDEMTESERMDMLNDMLEFGTKELRKVSQPQIQFTLDMLNIFAIPELKKPAVDFEPGNYVHVIIRDDYNVKARLLTFTVDFYDLSSFNATFGTLNVTKGKNLFTDVTKALDTATSVSSTVSFNSSYWNKANRETDNIGQMLDEGLIGAGKSITNSHSDVNIDNRGITVSNNEMSQYPNDRIFVGNAQILFSDDNFKTVKSAIGRLTYTKDGVQYNQFGVMADFIIAGYVAASIIEGNTIKGNDIQGNTITGNEVTGNTINNGNGTFQVDVDGNLTATSATIKGDITANTGYIGGESGFKIESGKLHTIGKDTLDDADAGVYVGTDGISLGANNPFKVTNAGKATINSATIGGLTVDSNGIRYAPNPNSPVFQVNNAGSAILTSGTIGGISIFGDSLRASNGNWGIYSNGTAVFKNVTITGVQPGSTFGDISYSNQGTYGNFGNGFYAGSSFGLNGGALTQFNSLVVNNITAENIKATNVFADYITAGQISANYATIGSLDAVSARVGSIEADYASVGELNAVSARIGTIESNYIDAGTVKAQYMEVANWTSAGYIRADKISTSSISAAIGQINSLDIPGCVIHNMTYQSDHVSWIDITVGKVTYHVLGSS